VDDQVDHGCIFLQAVVPILPGDDEVALSKRILDYEHRIYPTALKLLCEEKAILRDGKVHLSLDDEEYRHLLADFICPAEDP